MYKLPAIYVGEYAEKDASLTLDLFKRLSSEILSLPMFPEMTQDEIKYVCDKIREFYI